MIPFLLTAITILLWIAVALLWKIATLLESQK